MTLRALLLDAGGVFLLPHRPEVVALTAVEADEDHLRAHHHGMRALDADPERDDTYWPAYLEALDLAPTAERVAAARRIRWTSVIDDSLRALQRLAQLDLGLAIVSNADGRVEHDLLALGVCQVGEGAGAPVLRVVDSTVVGIDKPDPRIFEIALDAIGASAGEAMHVGDSVRFDVRGAEAAGVEAAHLDPLGLCADATHRHLRSLHDLVAELAG